MLRWVSHRRGGSHGAASCREGILEARGNFSGAIVGRRERGASRGGEQRHGEGIVERPTRRRGGAGDLMEAASWRPKGWNWFFSEGTRRCSLLLPRRASPSRPPPAPPRLAGGEAGMCRKGIDVEYGQKGQRDKNPSPPFNEPVQWQLAVLCDLVGG
jgi:hypothetical protein